MKMIHQPQLLELVSDVSDTLESTKRLRFPKKNIIVAKTPRFNTRKPSQKDLIKAVHDVAGPLMAEKFKEKIKEYKKQHQTCTEMTVSYTKLGVKREKKK